MARKPTRPDSVRIGALTYRVSEDPGELLKQEQAMGLQVHGMGDKTEQIIMLRPGLAPGFAKQTMIHEIVHQVFEASGWAPEGDAEELVCRHLEAGLLAVLRDNPDLVAWLTSPD